MKFRPTLILFVLAALVSCLAAADDDEKQGVKKALAYYMDGGTQGDARTVAKAFHPQAELKFVSEGEYREISLKDFLSRIGKPQERETRVLSIDVTGHAAHAKVELKYDDFSFIDYFNLLKIGGEWKIVNKIFYRRAH